MGKVLGKKPSPAMLVAIVALVAALCGTAIAGGGLTKKKVNKIITKRAPGLSVDNADKLDGKHASQLQTTSAYGENNADVNLTSSFQDVVTTSVTTAGTRVIANASVEFDSAGFTVHCRLRIDGSESTTYDTQDLRTEEVIAYTFARTVPAGTHAVALACSEGGGNVVANGAALSVVAVPE